MARMIRSDGAVAVLGAVVALLLGQPACSKFGAEADNPIANAPPPAEGGTSDAGPVERRLYLFGGEELEPFTPKHTVQTSYVAVLAPDGTVGSWNRFAALDVDRARAASTVVDDVELFFGGIAGGIPATQTAQKATLKSLPQDSSTAWTTLALFRAARSYASAAGANGAVYLSGGTTTANTHTDEVDRYDVAANSWTTPGKLDEALTGHASLVHGGQLLVIGGEGPSTTGPTGSTVASSASTAATIQADGTLTSWAHVGVLPVAVAYHAVVEVDPWVFAIGGAASAVDASVTAVQRGTLGAAGADLAWVKLADLPVPAGQKGVAEACVVADGRTIYVLGGRADPTSPSLAAVYIGRVDATGTVAWTPGPPLPQGRSGAGCAVSSSSAP